MASAIKDKNKDGIVEFMKGRRKGEQLEQFMKAAGREIKVEDPAVKPPEEKK